MVSQKDQDRMSEYYSSCENKLSSAVFWIDDHGVETDDAQVFLQEMVGCRTPRRLETSRNLSFLYLSLNYPENHQSNLPLMTYFLIVILSVITPPLHARTYELNISRQAEKIENRDRDSVVVNGQSPAPLLKFKEGEEVTLKVTNQLDTDSSIHWHGLILPYDMDGVPDISFKGIPPGTTFTYQFKVQQTGTYWYHGHSGFQEQEGLLGPILIEPKDAPIIEGQKSFPIVLSDWTDEDPDRIYAKLKAQPDYYNYSRVTWSSFLDQVHKDGFVEALKENLAWGQMRMNQTDLSDVSGSTYTYLINGSPSSSPWKGLVKPGEPVKLHFINASAMTYFDVSVPGLDMTVIEADGQAIKPIQASRLRIAVAETYTVIVTPKPGIAYAIFAESLDRSGFALASLTPRADLLPEIPPRTPPQYLTVEEVMSSHDMAGMGNREVIKKYPEEKTPMTNMEGMPMDHASMGHGPEMTSMAGMDHTGMSEHAMGTMPGMEAKPIDLPDYSSLTSATDRNERKDYDREIKIRLTGNMVRYIWSIDDVVYEKAEPIRLKLGERIKLTYKNETMMNHPMHLHGMWQDIDVGKGGSNPRKHVINVKPGETRSVYVNVDAPGQWAFHCHLVYHMAAGMFRKVIVE